MKEKQNYDVVRENMLPVRASSRPNHVLNTLLNSVYVGLPTSLSLKVEDKEGSLLKS